MTATTVFFFLFSFFLMLFFFFFSFRLVSVFLFILFLGISQVRSTFSLLPCSLPCFRHGHSMQFRYLHLAASGYARHRIVSIWVGIA